MKRFILKIMLFALVLAAIDILVGKTMVTCQKHAKGGDTQRMNMITDALEDKIIVFGSSRAIHHYDPIILQDSLGMTCYNAGKDGNGIIFNYGQYHLMASRYTPKILIYDIQPDFDLLEDDKTKYLDWLKRYYDRPGIDSIFWDVDPTLRMKMFSQMYRYNSSFLQIISDCVHPNQSDVKGYRPIDKTMEYEPKPAKATDTPCKSDELKLKYWQRLISECKNSGTTLIFMFSPQYKSKQTAGNIRMMEMAKEYGIPYINHFDDTIFSTNRKFFYDPVHMNRSGATEYTKYIIKELKSYISQAEDKG